MWTREQPERTRWLVQTKIHPPLPRDDTIPRPRLLSALHEGLTSCRLTLLSAPAGYGKTTLLSALPAAYPSLPLAWLMLDEDDNDLALFTAYLIAALHRLSPDCVATSYSLLTELANPGAETRRVIGVLINDILHSFPDHFGLIIEDLHRVDEPIIYATLDYLLEHLPPQMHLVITARYDPPLSLPRLRARRDLYELRTGDLRFTLSESAALLNDTLRLNLSPDDLIAIQERTEGWPVGLALLAGSLSNIPTPTGRSDFIAHLAHTDRYVFDFLADEVLNRQPPELRTFMLKTSILSELNPALCRAVTGRDDTAAMLETLERRSLFVTPADPSRSTFRYHPLFAEFLRHRLACEMPEQVTDLHRRAAQAQAVPDRAIGHYLAAEMWETAAQVIEQEGGRLLHQGLLDTLTTWIRALPNPVHDAHPRLLYLAGACAWRKDDWEAARPLLQRALRAFEDCGDEAGADEALADLATCALLQTDFGRADTLIRQALSRSIPLHSRVQLLMGRAWLKLMIGDWAQAAKDLDAALSVTRDSTDSQALHTLALYLGHLLVALPGGLESVEHFCRRATTHLSPSGLSRLAIEGQMTFIHFWRGRLDAALQAGDVALAISTRLGGYPSWDVDIAVVLGTIHAARGEYATADHFFDLMRRQIERIALDEPLTIAYLYPLGRARWLQGRMEEARRVYAQMEAATGPLDLPFSPMLRTTMRGLLEIADRHYTAAEKSLLQATQMERAMPPAAIFGSPRLLLACLRLEQDRPQDALAELEPLLAECERDGTPGRIFQQGAAAVPVLRLAAEHSDHAPFAAHLLDLLGATGEIRPTPIPETGATLTSRETEILRLLATGATNRAIAEQLVISEHTVKSHVYHIFHKLNVSTRAQAAARARKLRLA